MQFKIEGNSTKVAIPLHEPSTEQAKALMGLMISVIDQIPGYSPVVCTANAQKQQEFFSTVIAMKGSIVGACMVLKNKAISPHMTPTSDAKPGANFVVTRLIQRLSKIRGKFPYWNFTLQEKLASGTITAWASAGQLQHVHALNAIFTMVCDKTPTDQISAPGGQLNKPYQWLKKKEFFKQEFLPKKTGSSLYVTCEYNKLVEFHNSCSTKFEDAWSLLEAATWDQVSNGIKVIETLIDNLKPVKPEGVRLIDATKTARIKELGVAVRKRGVLTTTIAEGKDLYAKLEAIGYGAHPRIVPHVLFSRMYGITEGTWTNLVHSCTRVLYNHGNRTVGGYVHDRIEQTADADLKSHLIAIEDDVVRAVDTMLEAIPAHANEPSWRAAFVALDD